MGCQRLDGTAIRQSPVDLTIGQGTWGQVAKDSHEAIPRAFPKATDWNKTRSCNQPEEAVHDYYNMRQIVFKEILGLPLDVDSIWVAFSSMFVNGLGCEHLFLEKRARTAWETVSTPAVVHLANQPAGALEDVPKESQLKS